MHIAILESGRTNPAMPEKFQDWPDMFYALFDCQNSNADFRFSIVPVIDDVFPQSIDQYDGYLITGSAYGVYDNVPFIQKLIEFVQKIFAAGKPIVGICFGHQLIAHALGGYTSKFSGGWGVGTMRMNLLGHVDWIPSDIRYFDLIHFHQDQVEKLPRNAVRLAKSDFCRNAAFAIGNQVFAVQGHPEFNSEYTNALINIREEKIGKDRVEKARISLQNPHDGKRVGGWIINFFAMHDLVKN